MSAITHLRSLRFAADDPEALVGFYEDVWGLQRVAVDEEDTVYLRGRGREHHLLAISAGPARTLELISLGASSPAAVDRLADRLREGGVELTDGPGPRLEPGGGYAIRFRDPEGRLVEVSAEVLAHDDAGAIAEGPDVLSHAVLNSVDVATARDFYTEMLGFQISDWYEDELMVFLRCNEKHHCIVLAANDWVSLNHVAFEVGAVDDVMRSLGRLRRRGHDAVWGPGRHGPGGNVFCYFQDPAGNVVEYTAELLEVTDDWRAQEWRRTPENADVWGTGGGITPDVARAMSNPPPG